MPDSKVDIGTPLLVHEHVPDSRSEELVTLSPAWPHAARVVPSLWCHRLGPFTLGRLRRDVAERFREHLAGCDRCGDEMPRLLELICVYEDRARARRASPISHDRSDNSS